tara:strand:- start:1994 stop:2281 length:288 start_codon:yes stop_codon:yes gene_type:complete
MTNNNTPNERRIMKASEIKLGVEIRVETTNDAINVWPLNTKGGQEWHRDNYIKWYGDVDVEYDAEYNVYKVPAFKAERDRYCAAKAEHCRRWGSN